jgi:hypothetical protein
MHYGLMNRLAVILSDPLRQRLRGESEESPSISRRSFASLRMTGQGIGPLI